MRLVLLLLGLAACTAAPPGTTDGGPLPLVVLAPGAADTVDVRALAPSRADAPPGLRAALLPDGRLAVRAEADFVGIGLVGLGGDAALAVQSAEARETLHLRPVGPRVGDASVLDFRLTHDGAGAPPPLDEEDAVALWGDALVSDNALDVDAEAGVVGVDLDAVGPERRRLRVAVRTDGAVSNWVELEVADRRVVAR